MMRRRGRRGGRTVRTTRKGVRDRQTGDRHGAVILTEKITGDSDGANEAPRQHAWGKDSENGATAPSHAAAGAACGGRGDAVESRSRGGPMRMRGSVPTSTMVVAAAPPGRGGGNQGGGSGTRALLGLTDSTHLAGLVSDSQGVTCLTNGGNQRGRSDAMTDGMTGRGRTESPTNGDEKG